MRILAFLLVSLLPLGNHVLFAATERPIKLTDALAWKRIQTPIVSNNGEWFAYKLTPNDGNSELVVTHLADGKEQRFTIGQIVRINPYLRGGEAPARPAKHEVETWRVIDDWPQRVPVTQAEIDVFEAWFGDLFDELFGPR